MHESEGVSRYIRFDNIGLCIEICLNNVSYNETNPKSKYWMVNKD